jgi:predicted P-loop ATPase
MSVPAEAIERARSADILTVAQRFVILKRIATNEWAGPCPSPSCGGRDRFAVNTRKQVFNCRGCSAKGGAIDLVKLALGIGFAKAVEELTGRWTSPPPKARAPAKASEEEDAARKSRSALSMFDGARSIKGTIAETYLAQVRCVDLDQIPDLDGVLRFEPHCPFGPQRHPALISLIRDIVTNDMKAIQRTALDSDGQKIDRWGFGPKKGGAIKLWAAAGAHSLVIGEGLETVACAATRVPYRGAPLQPGWAVVDREALDHKRRKKDPSSPPPGGWPAWHSRLARDRNRIIADLANVLVALRGEERMMLACAFDEMAQHSLVTREWPRAPDADPVKPVPHETDDDDIARLTEWLQHMGIRKVGREVVGQAVEVFARERCFHPVRDYLDSLVWDRTKRLHRLLFTYFGAAAENDAEIEYVAAIGRMFLIAMVARIYKPGCQADYMPVLEGEQGSLKSSACRALAGDWFSDSLPENITSKDARQHLRGKWLIEVSELAAFTKAEVEALKLFITRREERYRPPFGRHDVMEPRQCLFVGTTNKEVYIKDETGGRRFWPVKCTAIDLNGLTQARDQLFAEAVQAYRARERWWPKPEDEDRYFKPQQDKRQEDDPWKPSVIEFWNNRDQLKRATVSQIARDALGFVGESRIGTAEARRISNILKDLKCGREITMDGRFYLRPGTGP